jgi:hypothetical protein
VALVPSGAGRSDRIDVDRAAISRAATNAAGNATIPATNERRDGALPIPASGG